MAANKIMIVEDNLLVAEDLKNKLVQLGYEISAVAKNGELAIAAAKERRPDLVLMDIELGKGMNGIDTAAMLRKTYQTPVVYLTAYADEKTLNRAKKTQPHGYIIKPFDERELKSTIEIALYKQASEQKIAESENWLQTTLESIGDGVIATDLNGKVVFINPIAEQLTGWSKNDAVGRPMGEIFNIISEKTGTMEENPVDRVLRDGRIVGLSNHTLLIRKNGTKIPIADSGAPIWDNTGALRGVVLVFRDQSKERGAQKAILKSEQKFRMLYENMAQGVFYQQADGQFIDVNRAALEMMGLTRDQFLGRTTMDAAWQVVSEEGDEIQGDQHPSMQALKTGKPVRDVVMGIFNPLIQEFVWLSINAIPQFRERESEPWQVFVTLHNITEIQQAKEREKEILQRLRLAMESAQEGVWEWEAGSDKVVFDEVACKMLGYDSDFPCQTKEWWFERIHPKDRQSVNKAFKAFLLGDSGKYAQEFRLKSKSGTYVWISSNARIIRRDSQGKPSVVAGIHRDITGRKTTESALIDVSKFNEKIISQSPVGIVLYEADSGNCIIANNAIARLVGATKDQVLAQNFYQIESWKRSGLLTAAKAALDQGRNEHLVAEVITTFDKKMVIDCYFAPVAFKKKPHLLITATDITERVKAEKDIADQKALMERYLNIAEVMIVGLDLEGRVNLANQKACRILEWEREDILGQNWFDICLPASSREEVYGIFKLLAGGNVSLGGYYENEVVSKSGARKMIAWHNTYIRDESGKITGILGSGEDITEKLKLQRQLRQSQKMESIGNLAGGIAHDFNNILMAMNGFAQLALSQAEEGSTLKDDIQEILVAGNRAKDLVQQILTFARQSEDILSPLRPGLIAKEIAKFIRSSVPSEILITQKIESRFFVLGDATKIHQIIMNLCTNAAQAMEREGGTLGIEAIDVRVENNDTNGPDLDPGSYVRLSVSDTGEGIAPDHMDKIFDPYFTTKAPGEGTGMGLAVVHGIVEKYKGAIQVQTEAGNGTTFIVYLPVAKQMQSGDRKPAGSESLPRGSERILVIDDEAPICKMISRSLSRLGYSVTDETDPLAALALFETDPTAFDLVMTDMTMPMMTGETLARKMMGIRSDIPIVLSTGYSKKMSDTKALEMGICAFVAKPLKQEDLALTLRQILDATNR